MNESKAASEISTARLESFSDGVFAIAITLLIIEIKVPDAEALRHQTLTQYIYAQWPRYFAYVLSFFVIGIYWANHHYLFKLFMRTDHVFNLLNLLFLMTISFLPYPTGVLGEYVLDAEHMNTAITFYAFAIWMPTFCWCMIWLYANHRRRIIDTRLSSQFLRYLTRMYVASTILFAAAVVISFNNPRLAIFICVGLTLLYLLPPKKPQFNSAE